MDKVLEISSSIEEKRSLARHPFFISTTVGSPELSGSRDLDPGFPKAPNRCLDCEMPGDHVIAAVVLRSGR
jgi:hypothetical protein